MSRLARRTKSTARGKVEGLTDKDLHCCSRVMQSIMFAAVYDDETVIRPFYGCNYCKYAHICEKNKIIFEGTRQRLQALTGVNLDPVYDENNIEEKFMFDFLKRYKGGEKMRRLGRTKSTARGKVKGLTDQDLHCCARVIQSILFAPTQYNEEGVKFDYAPLYGCNYCKYTHICFKTRRQLFEGTRQRLQALTGVDLHPLYNDVEKKFSQNEY